MTTTSPALWGLQHRSGAWLSLDPDEPAGRGWSKDPAQALAARDPLLFSSRVREALPSDFLASCRLVEVQP